MTSTSYLVLVALTCAVIFAGVAFQMGAGPVLARYARRHKLLLPNHPIDRSDTNE